MAEQGDQHVRPHSDWRTRSTAAQTRGRTIERQAEGLRFALVSLASKGGGSRLDVLSSVEAIREQLVLVEKLAQELNQIHDGPHPGGGGP
jgi:hypothetical protein